MELTVEQLTCLRGERMLFDPLSFSLKPGEGLFVRGPNGAGKSSLLKLLAGLLRPQGGQISFGGIPIHDDLPAWRRHIAYLGHLDGLKPAETAGEAVRFRAALFSSPSGRGCEAYATLSAEALAKADGISVAGEGINLKTGSPSPVSLSPKRLRETASPAGRGECTLSLLNMHSHATTAIRYLSAGQRRRVALAGVLASGATLWLLDEPTTALDAEAAALVYDALRQHLKTGGMVVAATHDDPPGIDNIKTLSLTVKTFSLIETDYRIWKKGPTHSPLPRGEDAKLMPTGISGAGEGIS